MKTLILAEKPSQGKLYAQALGGFSTKDGYLESDKYIISWAFGHLIELANDTTYRENGKWNKSYLPLIPNIREYQYIAKEDSGVKKQLKILETLFKNASEIYCATDSDREGELIFRYIYHFLKCKLPFKRVWISSLEDDEIRRAFQNPKFKQGDPFLENLSKSAYARAISDWLIGINGTQGATLQLGQGKLLSIGRVQTNILKIICERYQKNKNHQKTYTYKIIAQHEHNGIKFTSESPIFEAQNEAEHLFQNLNNHHNFVSFEKKSERKNPPLLHTLDSLTIVANKLFKHDASEVLASAQRLYEGKFISYPRTEDPYITDEGYEKLQKFLPKFAENYLQISDFSFPTEKPKSVDASKITGSHDAIIPTGQTQGIEHLSQTDRQIFKLILHRCLESFSEVLINEKGVYLFENQGSNFKTLTKKILQEGWTKYSPKNGVFSTEEKEEEEFFTLHLPYQNGDKVLVQDKNLKEIESKPPSLYTPATLIADLSNLAKFLKEENPKLYEELSQSIDLKSLQIGTKATRPDIIKNLIEKRKFIDFQKNKYIPTELGMNFYQTIKNMEVVNVAETAKLENRLKSVAEGNLSVQDFYTEVGEYVRRMVENLFGMKSENLPINAERKTFGTCPECQKGQIIEGKKSFGCSEWKGGCSFTIWKEIAGKKLTEKNISDLVSKGKTALIKGFKSKAGKNFDAFLVLENGKVGFEFGKK